MQYYYFYSLTFSIAALAAGIIICIRYCMLQSRVSALQSTVTRMYSEAGLPEDYDYEQDAVY